MTKTINILGTMYSYTETSKRDDPQLCSAHGYCDDYAKKIVVRNDYNENNPNIIEDIDAYMREVKRHEITHAFLSESGMTTWSGDEKLVEWIARQFPKMIVAFNDVGALHEAE